MILDFQNKQLIESVQQELKQEKQAKQEAEATVGQLELEIKKLQADLHVRCPPFCCQLLLSYGQLPFFPTILVIDAHEWTPGLKLTKHPDLSIPQIPPHQTTLLSILPCLVLALRSLEVTLHVEIGISMYVYNSLCSPLFPPSCSLSLSFSLPLSLRPAACRRKSHLQELSISTSSRSTTDRSCRGFVRRMKVCNTSELRHSMYMYQYSISSTTRYYISPQHIKIAPLHTCNTVCVHVQCTYSLWCIDNIIE